MEEDQSSHSTTAKKWEQPWSTSEIRENSANWTLAGDTGLLNFLQEYAHNLISRTHETEKLVNELVYRNKAVSAKVNNVINDFQMLSNEQFIENRVYDEEIEDTKPSENVPEMQKTKEQREAEMIPRVTRALSLGLSVLDQAFHKVQVEETSDSEDDECRVEELEPKDPYEHRPLPFIIGSNEFHQDDFVGLRDMYVEEFVETPVDEESVSIASLSSSSFDESDVEVETPYTRETITPKDYAEDIVPPRNIDRPKSSVSESSDLFDMEREDNDDFTSNLEEEEKMLKENEQNKRLNTDDLVKEVKSVIRHKIEPDATKVSQPPKQEKYDDDLFGSVESDNIIDENSPFQKKPGGLFSTDLAFTNRKDEASDDDLFGTTEKNQVISSKPKPAAPPVVASSKETEKKAPDLFGESDDENEDIFATLTSSKKPFSLSQPTTAAIKDEHNVAPKVSDSFTSGSEVTKKKSNNAFPDFAVQSSSDSDSLFGDAPAMDDLFITKPEKKLSVDHFMADDDDESDLFSSMKSKHSESIESKKKEVKVEHPPQQSKKLESSLFGGDDDDEDYDLFSSTKMPYTFASPKTEAPDLFDSGKGVSSKHTESSKEVLSSKEDLFKSETSKSTVSVKKTHTEILNTTKETYAKNTVSVKESSDHKSKISSTTSPLSSVDKIQDKTLSTTENEMDISVSFDAPVDPHNTLNAINKGRAKIPGKRRKPTRKARRASLTTENADSEIEESAKTSVVTNSPLIQNDQSLSDGSDLFDSTPSDVRSSEPQITPKKLVPYGINKNVMSQLVSEISNSKVGKKDSVSKKRDSFEDDSDDFFSSAPSGKSDLETSDFLPVSPKRETVVETSRVPSTTEVGAPVKDSDLTFEDDLFSEPAFKGFSSSIPESDSIFNMDDDEDIFKIVNANKQKASIPSGESSDDIFAYPEEDIFAGMGKEKYEMTSNSIYDDDDDDDIFGNLDAPVKQATSGSNTKKTSKVEAPKKEPVDIFDDPLTGFSSE